ncbi:STAS domain-containing protein [Dactylosporangium aurantiacum]|uniref:Anti-sigma factor antagonist n=1 Tax=Dactylosporangium aurantiacum TaxID=35754 RepID=A0A9Q9ICU7_9ACTN|nr:STAS domain-containing protein [Dactylosporangium aurantiacum]MDG6108700.1 STAS domain-containing protein [Dactylosporangium aurantiacum]UWZ51064.1 STAS domain-containing protein [Dactylosporangium aurantiacum]
MAAAHDDMQPITQEPARQLVEVSVTDPLDTSATPRVRALLDDAAALRPADLVVDMTACTYVDATGIGMLLDVHRKVWRDGGRLTLRNLSPKVARTLQLARVDRVLHVTGTAVGPANASS